MSAILACIIWNRPIGWPNCAPVVDIGNNQIEARLHDAERAGRQNHALIVETRHQDVDAIADRAQHIVGRHLAILEDDLASVGAAHAELVELGAVEKPLNARSTMKAVMPRAPAVGSVLA